MTRPSHEAAAASALLPHSAGLSAPAQQCRAHRVGQDCSSATAPRYQPKALAPQSRACRQQLHSVQRHTDLLKSGIRQPAGSPQHINSTVALQGHQLGRPFKGLDTRCQNIRRCEEQMPGLRRVCRQRGGSQVAPSWARSALRTHPWLSHTSLLWKCLVHPQRGSIAQAKQARRGLPAGIWQSSGTQDSMQALIARRQGNTLLGYAAA